MKIRLTLVGECKALALMKEQAKFKLHEANGAGSKYNFEGIVGQYLTKVNALRAIQGRESIVYSIRHYRSINSALKDVEIIADGYSIA